MTRIKICGITQLEDALMVSAAGADLLGLNFYPPSPRYIAPAAAQTLIAALRQNLQVDCPIFVGVFVNASAGEIQQIMTDTGLDYAQLSGDEDADTLAALSGKGFKAIRPKDREDVLRQIKHFGASFPEDERVPALLIDAYHPELYGGTGEQASAELSRLAEAHVPRLMVAGGLTPDNVGLRVQQLQPWGVDVASGVEAGQPGIKDADKVHAFIQAVRKASSQPENPFDKQS